MKANELLKIGTQMLKIMSENGIMVKDFEYLDSYEDYKAMRRKGMKYDAVMTILTDRYHVARRTLQRAFNRLDKEC